MVYRPPTHGISTPLTMVYRPPTHGILTPLTMVYRPPYPWYIDPPYPWYIDPPTHGILTPCPWNIDPPTYGISNPLLCIMNSSLLVDMKGGSIYHEGVQNTMTKN